MTQCSYIQELLNRYGVEEESGTPITKWTEPNDPSPITAEKVREAQAITGALLWVSTRTRPDLAYVVAHGDGKAGFGLSEIDIGYGYRRPLQGWERLC